MALNYAPNIASALLSTPIAVLVVDDQLAVREGLARLITCASIPLRAVCTAATPAEALRMAQMHHPEVVVLDVDLAGEDGLALLAHLSPAAGVLVLTSHGDSATRARAVLLGALAFIEKHQPAADLLGAIVRVAHMQIAHTQSTNTQLRGDKAPGSHGTSPLPTVVAGSVVLASPSH
jgi:two-component system, NarL family, nitrate/nitrite response regulator NarL